MAAIPPKIKRRMRENDRPGLRELNSAGKGAPAFFVVMWCFPDAMLPQYSSSLTLIQSSPAVRGIYVPYGRIISR